MKYAHELILDTLDSQKKLVDQELEYWSGQGHFEITVTFAVSKALASELSQRGYEVWPAAMGTRISWAGAK